MYTVDKVVANGPNQTDERNRSDHGERGKCLSQRSEDFVKESTFYNNNINTYSI